ncbi:MAM domain-containing 2 isoform X1 [Pelobates cultripes]|uniref:MAM domain-containing 2 isoform X1 n=1 Tax=Pelobates cultripes TaxID=61616 RepID=A0AAD1W9I4_PELCU|nr:MAM domain-containing 2 isoform X1 [Pelobates cultripes]
MARRINLVKHHRADESPKGRSDIINHDHLIAGPAAAPGKKSYHRFTAHPKEKLGTQWSQCLPVPPVVLQYSVAMLLLVLYPCVLMLSCKAVLFAEGVEISSGSCTFENSTCAYKSAYSFLPWTVNSEGHYISVDTLYGTSGQKAVLVSPDLQPDEWSCLKLVYQIAGSESSVNPSKLNVFIQPDGESFDYLLWTAEEQSDSWLISSIDLRNTSRKYKIIIEGILGTDEVSSIAIFELKMTTGYCIECDFEENHLCGYMNSWNPNVNWFVGGGNIRNSHSILPKDHTLNSEIGHYMYVDSVYVKAFQEVAQLVSPLIITPISGCLSFYYQIQQEGSNDFMVFTRDLHGSYEEIWKMKEARKGEWNFAEVDLNALLPVEVIFEVAFNGIEAGYVALDDISFSPESCSGQKDKLLEVKQTLPKCVELMCHECKAGGLRSDWLYLALDPKTRPLSGTPLDLWKCHNSSSRLTVCPSGARKLCHCVEPLECPNLLLSMVFQRSQCGSHLVQNTFQACTKCSVYFANPCTKCSASNWCILLPLLPQINVKSSKECGAVKSDGMCLPVAAYNCLWADRLPPSPGKCTFEKNDCGFQQEWQRRGMWHRIRGRTPTSYTGPTGDHTSGVGLHLYMSGLSITTKSTTRAMSPSLTKRVCICVTRMCILKCVTFFFCLYIVFICVLCVTLCNYVVSLGGPKAPAPVAAATLLHSKSSELVFVLLTTKRMEHNDEGKPKIIFEAVRGISIRSDVAIDDIVFQNGHCKDTGDFFILQSSGTYLQNGTTFAGTCRNTGPTFLWNYIREGSTRNPFLGGSSTYIEQQTIPNYCFSDHPTARKAWVAILMVASLQFQELDREVDTGGRSAFIKGKVQGRRFTLATVYVPNRKHSKYLRCTIKKLAAFTEGTLEPKLDSSTNHSSILQREIRAIQKILRSIRLVDCWRALHPTTRLSTNDTLE